LCFRLELEVKLGQPVLAEDLVGEEAVHGGVGLDEGGRCRKEEWEEFPNFSIFCRTIWNKLLLN
jgi:hypothetical protein